VGIDDEGDEITSCVAVPDESAEAIKQAKRQRCEVIKRLQTKPWAKHCANRRTLARKVHQQEGRAFNMPMPWRLLPSAYPLMPKHKTSRAKVAITDW